MDGVKHIIAVASGKGGVGKSTVTVNLALALAAQGHRVGVLDADIYGPSQAQMLGVKEGVRPQAGANNKFLPLEAHGLQAMSMAFMVNTREPMVWRGPMVVGAFQQMLTQTQWDNLDFLLIDMPPGTGDIQLTLAQKVPVAGAVIVTTPQEPEWEGHVTLEFSNTTNLPAKIYAHEGVAQMLFLESDEVCETSYKDRGGKYMGQRGVTLPRT